MNRYVVAALAAASLCAPARAAAVDPQRAAVLAAVQQFFDGMAANDPGMIADVSLTGGLDTSVRQAADGSTKVTRTPHQQFLEPRAGADRYLERIWAPQVSLRGPMAVVWAPYEFQLNGQPHHCGIDVFNLVKSDGRWKIAAITWTTEPEACAELKAR